MELFASLVPLVILIPLGGMMINLFLGARMGEKAVGLIASLAAGLAFGIALVMTVASLASGGEAAVVPVPLISDWISIPAGKLSIPWELRVDTLSLTMMLVVTGVGTLIHIYAVGYMHGDSRFPRFFVYMNLFLAFMLILVTGNNFLVTFVGWEGVGLCSFLLIGFWFDKKRGEGWKNSNAARKAFIVNRIGDFGFLIAIFLIFWTFGTLDYYKAHEPVAKLGHAATESTEEHGSTPNDPKAAPAATAAATKDEHSGEKATPAATAAAAKDEHSDEKKDEKAAANTGSKDEHGSGTPTKSEGNKEPAGKGVFALALEAVKAQKEVPLGPYKLPINTVLALIGLCMLVGVTGKSAQIPLFVWLPDAMAGPTPVSALIHAATMVTAGIFLMVRSNVIFSNAPQASALVTIIGTVTALMAGFIALGQWDIKKVLAYSTVSQLGFMVAAVGLGGYVAGIFHLVTHAFFKALLFLGSGSVIHGVEHGHHLAHGGGHGGGLAGGYDPNDSVEAHDAHGAHGGGHGEHDSHADASHAEHEEDHGEVFDPQDMRNMGGLRDRMPITFWTYLIGTLALAGIFPLAGFWSKDEILGNAFNMMSAGRTRGTFAFVLLLVAAAFTAFYMWRQINLVFLGKPRTDAAKHAPESVRLMTVPLMILAVLSVLGGLLNLPLGTPGAPASWLEGLTKWLEESVSYATGGTLNVGLAAVATAVSLGAIWLAHRVYGTEPLAKENRDQLQENESTRWAFSLANAKLYWDEIYGAIIEQPYNRLSKFFADTLDWRFWHDYVHNNMIVGGFNGMADFLSRPFDRGIIDAGFNALGGAVTWLSSVVRRTQTGYVRTYAFTVVLGVLFILLVILFPVIRQLPVIRDLLQR